MDYYRARILLTSAQKILYLVFNAVSFNDSSGLTGLTISEMNFKSIIRVQKISDVNPCLLGFTGALVLNSLLFVCQGLTRAPMAH